MMVGIYNTRSGADTGKIFLPATIPVLSVGADLCVCPGAMDLRGRGRHTGLPLRCLSPKKLQKEIISRRRSAAKKRLRRSKIFLICLAALCGFGCRAEKAQDIRPAERVELLVLDESDPRPYFHAELKFADPDQVKLPIRAEELRKKIKV